MEIRSFNPLASQPQTVALPELRRLANASSSRQRSPHSSLPLCSNSAKTARASTTPRGSATCRLPSIPPKAIEAFGVHFGVPRRVRDLPMPEISSEGPGVDAIVDQLEPGGVAQQMLVNVAHADAFGRSRQCLKEAIDG